MRTDRLSGIGVLYESDEWSDHKLAAELVTALAETCGDRHDTRGLRGARPCLRHAREPRVRQRALPRTRRRPRVHGAARGRSAGPWHRHDQRAARIATRSAKWRQRARSRKPA